MTLLVTVTISHMQAPCMLIICFFTTAGNSSRSTELSLRCNEYEWQVVQWHLKIKVTDSREHTVDKEINLW